MGKDGMNQANQFERKLRDSTMSLFGAFEPLSQLFMVM
jgi:hypothetical protein